MAGAGTVILVIFFALLFIFFGIPSSLISSGISVGALTIGEICANCQVGSYLQQSGC